MTSTHQQPTPTPEFTILIDGGCALCAREATLMEKLDKGRGKLAIVDIAQPDFSPADYGKTYAELMAHIHGQLPDGTVVTGVEVFRRAYAAVGWGWTLSWTALPVFRQLADAAYTLFAKVRLHLPGNRKRCTADACPVPASTKPAPSN